MFRSSATLALVALLATGCSDKGTSPTRSENVLNGQVAIASGWAQVYWVTVTEGMKDVVLAGEFRTTFGGSLDIDALVLDDVGYVNWNAGNNFSYLYYQNRVTAGRFSVPLTAPGRYCFVLSNRFSLLTDKAVSTSVAMTYRE